MQKPEEIFAACWNLRAPRALAPLTDERWEECVLDWSKSRSGRGVGIIAGDINCHGSWSGLGTSAGDRVEEWCVTRGQEVLNDPLVPTRIATTTNPDGELMIQESSPDVFIARTQVAVNCFWEALPDECCGSDHVPSQLTFRWPRGGERGVGKPRKKWKLKKADWKLFSEELEGGVDVDVETTNAQQLYDALELNIKMALRKSVPRSSRAKEYVWWNDEVDSAVKSRRMALKRFRETKTLEDGEVYLEMKSYCGQVIREAKRRSWEDFCSTLNPSVHDNAIWRVISALDGSQPKGRNQYPLVLPKVIGEGHNIYVDERSKAEAFNKHNTRSEHYTERRDERRAYRRIRDRAKAELFGVNVEGRDGKLARGTVVRVLVGDEDGAEEWYEGVITHVDESGDHHHCRIDWINGDEPEWLVLDREKWQYVDTSDRDEYDCPFTASEVRFALNTMSLDKAGGSDDIPMQCLKHLPNNIIDLFVDILNKTWGGDPLPFQWRTSRLCPIPKAKAGAFRPIALTNAFSRLADKLVTRRTTHFLEIYAKSIQPEQSGFRRGMSAEQQACAFAQYLEDEVQKDRVVVSVFLDATSAYDYVRHDVLLARLGSLFMPPKMWTWLRNFIKNRIVHTLWGVSRSRSRIMRRGVPQGCSVSPILWLAYMSPLISYLWDGTVDGALFRTFCLADDVCITMSVNTKELNSKLDLLQKQLDGAHGFFSSSSIKLNASKSALVVFSTNSNIRNMDVKLHIGGEEVPRVADQRMLGLYVDEGLTYAKHCDIWRSRVFSRIRILNHVSTRSWGTSFRSTRQIADQFIMSSALYAIPGFYGATSSKRSSSRLKTAYNAIMRQTSGCLLATDVKKLPMIVGWDGLEERVQRRAAHLAHMSLRHDQMTPAKSLILDDVAKKKRRKQRGWRDLSTKFLPQSLYSYIEPLPKRIAPWLSLPINFYAAHCDRKDDDSIRQMAALKVINSARERAKSDDRVLWEIWSDGSVDSETGYGGAGGAIWSNDGVEPFWSKSVPAGMYASSYNAEVHALYCSVETFDGFISSLDVKPDHAVLLVCDSSSLFPALQSDPYSLSADVIPVWKLLDKISTFVSSCEFIWISSHCDIVRSDIVDILARSGTKMDQTACPLSVSAVKAYINRGRVRESVLKLPEDPSSLELDIPVCLRYIHCALNQIWSGKWSECYDYQVKIGKAGSPFCPTCLRLGVEVVDDVDHRLFRCPRFREVRLRCFGLSSLEPDRCDYVGRNTVKVARFVALARDV